MNNGWKKNYLRYKDFFLNIKGLYNTKPNLKIYLELLLSIFTIAIFAFFAVKPTVLTIIELEKQIKSKEETLIILKQKIKNLQIASNLLTSESQNIQYIEQAVPKNANPETLIKQIEEIANENSLQILTLSFSDITLLGKTDGAKKTSATKILANGANQLAFTFSATGSYQNINSFLIKLENLRRPTKIDSYIINSSTTETGKRIVLTITGRVPYAE
ncbi:MAG: hypothetical protein ACD_19C00016G0037 [uncultured bacterium]|nr:MAG: hypothetical protein ACD_19C00016G0037 [uncultured bacterium]